MDRYSMHLSEPWWPYELGMWLRTLIVDDLFLFQLCLRIIRFLYRLGSIIQLFGGRYLNAWKPDVGRDPCYGLIGSSGRQSSVTSAVYWRAQCLVRIIWIPVWEITFSSALVGQTLGCTLGLKLDSSRTDCAFLWCSVCWSSLSHPIA